MAEIASAFVTIAPSMRGFRQGVTREVGAAGDQASGSFGKRFGAKLTSQSRGIGRAFGKGIAGGALAVAAGSAIAGAFLKDALGEAREAQKVGAVTNQIIKATGGVAKISSKQVGDLATAISNKAGVDDEAIQSGANLLLTFKNVRNEAGKGAKIFDRATKAAVDLSAAGFGSIESGSKMLGKALNDPVKGLSALSRAGVTFTSKQKAMVKALVEGGDANAAVASGLVADTKNWNDLAKAADKSGESYASFAKRMLKDLTPAQRKQFDFLSEGGHMLEAQQTILKEVEGQVGGTAEASSTAGEKMSVAWGNLKEQIGTALLPLIDRVANFMTKKVIPAVSGFITEMQTGEGAGGRFVEIARSIGAALQTAADWIGPLIPKVVGFFKSLSSGGDRLGEVNSTFKSVFDSVKSIVTDAVTIVTRLWGLFGDNIVRYLQGTFSNLLQILRGAFKVVQGIFRTVAALLKGDWKGVWDGIKQILSGAVGVLIGVVKQLWNAIRFAFRNAGVVLKKIAGGIWDGVKAQFKEGVDALVEAIRGLPAKIKALRHLLKEAGKSVMNALLNGLSGSVDFVGNIADKIWDAVKGMLNGAIDKINAALEFEIDIPGPNISVNIKDIPHLARGTNFHRGGVALVGEEGPELVNIPRGASVLSAPRTAALAAGLGGAAVPAIGTVNVQAHDYQDFERQILQRKQRVALGGWQ